MLEEKTDAYKKVDPPIEPSIEDVKVQLSEYVKSDVSKQYYDAYKQTKKAVKDLEFESVADHVKLCNERCGIKVDTKELEEACKRYKKEMPTYRSLMGNVTAVQSIIKQSKPGASRPGQIKKLKAGIVADNMVISKLLSDCLDKLEKLEAKAD